MATRSRRTKPLCNASARFDENGLWIKHPPATKAALQDAGWRLLNVDRDEDQPVRIKQRDDRAFVLE